MENSRRTYDQRPVNLSVRLVVACAASLVAASISGTILYRSLKSQRETPDIRFLLADDWNGKPWPIADNFDAELKNLTVGKWLVIVFRIDCEHCKALAKRIDDQQNLGADRKPTIVSFVAGHNDWPVHFGRASISLESKTVIHWNERNEPFVASPAAFLLEDGKVVDAKDVENADSLVQRILNLP
ncbi:MAG: hypothetical protein NTU79_15520 [Planctomycetota bacterium]|nr:hypothetical protein [Planctomycetota bacterium]